MVIIIVRMSAARCVFWPLGVTMHTSIIPRISPTRSMHFLFIYLYTSFPIPDAPRVQLQVAVAHTHTQFAMYIHVRLLYIQDYNA